MSSVDSLYARLGGEPALRQFVESLYDFMDESPVVEHVRGMHPVDLSNARGRLFMFLSGMLGGPPLYMQAYGHPRLRRRHLQFDIGDAERDQWLLCAQYAADELDITAELRDELMHELIVTANHLRNKDTSAVPCEAAHNNAMGASGAQAPRNNSE